MAHAQEPDFVFRSKRTSPFKSAGGRQFSRLLAANLCASEVVMLDTPCSEVVWSVLATHCIRQFPLHFHLPYVTVCHHISSGLYRSWTPEELHQTRSQIQSRYSVFHSTPKQKKRASSRGNRLAVRNLSILRTVNTTQYTVRATRVQTLKLGQHLKRQRCYMIEQALIKQLH